MVSSKNRGLLVPCSEKILCETNRSWSLDHQRTYDAVSLIAPNLATAALERADTYMLRHQGQPAR
jgi:hypothetical protein